MRMDGIEVKFSAPGMPETKAKPYGDFKSVGDRVLEQKDELFRMLKSHRRAIVEVGLLHQPFEQKTVLDSAAIGRATAGILNFEREPGIVSLARRRLTVRDLIRSKPITSTGMDWVKETVATYGASPQTESSAKAETTQTFAIASKLASTIAHFINTSTQILDDLPELQRFLSESLIYGLKLKEELEFLVGDGLGSHQSGIITQATAYAGTYVAANDTRLDTLRHAIAELQVAEENPNAMVVNPVDMHYIELIKTEENGTANKGSYVVGDPLGGVLQGRALWGLPTVVTNSIPVGKFLVGDWSKALIGDRMDATVDMSREHNSNFTENKLTLLAEERVVLAVTRPGAFRYGSF